MQIPRHVQAHFDGDAHDAALPAFARRRVYERHAAGQPPPAERVKRNLRRRADFYAENVYLVNAAVYFNDARVDQIDD